MSAEKEKSVTNQIAKARRERTPINGSRTILEVRGKEPGFHYAWINEDKVYQAIEASYEHVRHAVTVGTKRIDVSQMPTTSYVTRNVGLGQVAYLMRIPEEFHRDDMAAVEQLTKEQIQARVSDLNSDGLSGSISEGGQVPVHSGHRPR